MRALSGRFKSFANDPHPSDCRKLFDSKNDWRIRVGDYRVIYLIVNEVCVVRINRVRHRCEFITDSKEG